MSKEKRKEFLAALVKQAEFLEVTEQITDCCDAKDNNSFIARFAAGTVYPVST